MRDTIIALVGASGTGKTTVAKALVNNYKLNMIHSYTTRPPRTPDEWGHIFVTNEAEGLPDKAIAYTRFSDYSYWATADQYKGKGWSVYVIDPPGIRLLKERVSARVIVVCLIASEDIRQQRMTAERGKEAATKRIYHDRGVFGFVECDYVIDTSYLTPAEVARMIGLIRLEAKYE